MEKKPTVGELSAKLLKNVSDNKHTAYEQMREQLTDYEKSIYECYHANRNTYKDVFYIVVLTRGDKSMKNVLRNQFFARHTCPIPDYDQTVYRCNKLTYIPQFLWTVPCQDRCQMMYECASQVPPEEYCLLKYVMEFYDGTLLKLAMQLNNEEFETGQIIITENSNV